MKKLQILIIALFVSSTICALTIIPAHASPAIILSPNSGQVGSTVTLSGSSFSPNSEFSVWFGGLLLTTSITDPTGDIQSGVTFKVPSSSAGDQSVVVTDVTGNNVSATFLVAPTVSASPGTIYQGQTRETRQMFTFCTVILVKPDGF